MHVGSVARRPRAYVAFAVTAISLLLAARPASAQISGGTSNPSGATCSGGGTTDGDCRNSTSVPVNNGTTLQSRYAWNINADTGAFSTHDTSSNAKHNISFSVTAATNYRLDIATSRVGDMNRVNDVSGCDGAADTSGITGTASTSFTGSLSTADPGALTNGGSTGDLPYNQTSSATITGTSNGVAQSHSLTFTWNGSVRSNSCEASVRQGESSGTTTGCSACGYPGSPGRTAATDGQFVTITLHRCGDGVIDASLGETCDQGAGNGAAVGCCDSACHLRSSGTVCRASGGVCDPQEVCDGSSGACPADSKTPFGTICRGPAGPCDQAETCDGTSPDCPNDVFLGSTSGSFVCRPAAGTCDHVEVCDGTGPNCPADTFLFGNTCRASAGVCDPAESCDGTGANCPADAKSTSVCRPSAGPCDPAESCDGVGNNCPADILSPSSSVCRPAAGECDQAENCTGSSASCPADGVKSNGTACTSDGNPCSLDVCNGTLTTCTHPAGNAGATCRAAAGACDIAETCTGASTTCPADAKSTAVCRPSAGDCDVAESCDGVNNNCPADALQPATVVCRASAGPCDTAENCTGTTPNCPADAFTSAGGAFVCRPSAGACDPAEICDGTQAGCPADAKSTAVCRASAGPCDVAESCDGVNNSCPADAKQPNGTVCRAAAGGCDIAETCNGSSSACPADAVEPGGFTCRASTGPCDPAETCNGTGTSCPADVTSPDSDGDGQCDLIDNCPNTPNNSQTDGDGDGIGDACDPCNNLTPIFAQKAKITINKLNTAPGDDRVKFQGQITLPHPYSPPLDPLTKGVRVLINRADGSVALDATIPGGAFSTATKAGWKVNGAHTSWTYTNSGKIVPLISGINRVNVKDASSKTPGLLKFSVSGKKGSYPVPIGEVPVQGTFVVDSPTATTGQCGEARFPGPPPSVPACVFVSSGATLRCK